MELRKVKANVLRKMVQRNLYARGANSYDEYNSAMCELAMQRHGYKIPVWMTENQIMNVAGKYPFKGVQLLPGQKPSVVIKKRDNSETDKWVRTPLYNVEQTNMSIVAPGAYALLQQGKGFDEISDILMHQSLMVRAMHGEADKPKNFFRRLLGNAAI